MDNNVIFQPHAGPQTEALQRSEYEILYGGSRGCGKSIAGMAWLVDPRYVQHPLYRALVIRRNYDDLRDWIDRARFMYRSFDMNVVGNPAEFRFASGAKIRTGHLQDKDAYTKYLGHEYHRMVVEEATLIPEEVEYLRLISSLRSTVPELRPQIFLTTNPGGPGHNWLKERFVNTCRNKSYNDPISGRSRIFIPALIKDNPTLMKEDPDYVKSLEALPEELRRAWLEGDWDIFAGQYFKKFRLEHHVIEPFEIPNHWFKYRAIDYGYAAPFCCLWLCVDYDKNVYVYKEHYEAGQELTYHIEKIKEFSEKEEYMGTLADPSMWIRNPQNTNRSDGVAPSHQGIAHLMGFSGINCIKANNDRINGWNLIRSYLNWDKDNPSRLKIFSNCENLVRTLPAMIHDEKRPEDLDTKQEDHGVDALRYGLAHLGSPSIIKKKSWVDKELAKLLKLETDYPGVRN
mgnify:CR=1 FL=1